MAAPRSLKGESDNGAAANPGPVGVGRAGMTPAASGAGVAPRGDGGAVGSAEGALAAACLRIVEAAKAVVEGGEMPAAPSGGRVPTTLAEAIAAAQAKAHAPRGKRALSAAAHGRPPPGPKVTHHQHQQQQLKAQPDGTTTQHQQAQPAAANNAVAPGQGGKSVSVASAEDKTKTPYWQVVDEHLRDLTVEDVRNVFLTSPAAWTPALDPAFVVPPLGRNYVTTWNEGAKLVETLSAPPPAAASVDDAAPAITSCAAHELAALAAVLAQLDAAATAVAPPSAPSDGVALAARAVAAASATTSTHATVSEMDVKRWLTNALTSTTPGDANAQMAVREWMRSRAESHVAAAAAAAAASAPADGPAGPAGPSAATAEVAMHRDGMPIPQPEHEAMHPYTARILRAPAISRTRDDLREGVAAAPEEACDTAAEAPNRQGGGKAKFNTGGTSSSVAARCDPCLVQRRGKCGTTLAPPGCLRRPAAAKAEDGGSNEGAADQTAAHCLLVNCIEKGAPDVTRQVATATLRQQLTPQPAPQEEGCVEVANPFAPIAIQSLLADAPEDEVLEELVATQAELLAVRSRNQERLEVMIAAVKESVPAERAELECLRKETREVRQFLDEQRELRRLQKRERKRREEAAALAAATAAVETSSRGGTFRGVSASLASAPQAKFEPVAKAEAEAALAKAEPAAATNIAIKADDSAAAALIAPPLDLVDPHARGRAVTGDDVRSNCDRGSEIQRAQAGRAALGAASASGQTATAAMAIAQGKPSDGDAAAVAAALAVDPVTVASTAPAGSLTTKELTALVASTKEWKQTRDALRNLHHLVQRCENRETAKRELARVEQELDDMVADYPHLHTSMHASPTSGDGHIHGGTGTGKRKGKRAAVQAEDADGVVARAVVMTSDAARRTNSQLPPGFRYVPLD